MVYPSSSNIGLIASKNNSLYGPGDVPTVIVSFSSTAESSLPPQAARITKSIAEAAINNIFRLFNFTPPFSTSTYPYLTTRFNQVSSLYYTLSVLLSITLYQSLISNKMSTIKEFAYLFIPKVIFG